MSFLKRDERVTVFAANDLKGFRPQDLVKLQDNVVVIPGIMTWKDPNVAQGCIVAAVDLGDRKALTHMTIRAPVGRLLDTVCTLGKGSKLRACLVGGNNRLSEGLLADIQSGMLERGIINDDKSNVLMGPTYCIDRQVTVKLENIHVDIHSLTPERGSQYNFLNLNFPQIIKV